MQFITLLVLVFGTAEALAQANYETEVIQADAWLNELIQGNEAAKAELLYAEDFVLTTSNGKSKAKADMLREIGSPGLKLEINETENVKVRVLNSTAVLTGRLHQKGTYHGKPFDNFLSVTDTWVKTETGWKLLAGHATLLPSNSK